MYSLSSSKEKSQDQNKETHLPEQVDQQSSSPTSSTMNGTMDLNKSDEKFDSCQERWNYRSNYGLLSTNDCNRIGSQSVFYTKEDKKQLARFNVPTSNVTNSSTSSQSAGSGEDDTKRKPRAFQLSENAHDNMEDCTKPQELPAEMQVDGNHGKILDDNTIKLGISSKISESSLKIHNSKENDKFMREDAYHVAFCARTSPLPMRPSCSKKSIESTLKQNFANSTSASDILCVKSRNAEEQNVACNASRIQTSLNEHDPNEHDKGNKVKPNKCQDKSFIHRKERSESTTSELVSSGSEAGYEASASSNTQELSSSSTSCSSPSVSSAEDAVKLNSTKKLKISGESKTHSSSQPSALDRNVKSVSSRKCSKRRTKRGKMDANIPSSSSDIADFSSSVSGMQVACYPSESSSSTDESESSDDELAIAKKIHEASSTPGVLAGKAAIREMLALPSNPLPDGNCISETSIKWNDSRSLPISSSVKSGDGFTRNEAKQTSESSKPPIISSHSTLQVGLKNISRKRQRQEEISDFTKKSIQKMVTNPLLNDSTVIKNRLTRPGLQSTHNVHARQKPTSGFSKVSSSFDPLQSRYNKDLLEFIRNRKELNKNFHSAFQLATSKDGNKKYISGKSSPQNGPFQINSSSRSPCSRTNHSNSSHSLICNLGVDAMATIFSYLQPIEAYTLISTPISKSWYKVYTVPPDLWKILCFSSPFHAKIGKDKSCDKNGNDYSSSSSFPMCEPTKLRHLLGRYRLLYTSFIKCMRYLERIKYDTINGHNSSSFFIEKRKDFSRQSPIQYPFNDDASIQSFFARAGQISSNANNVDASSSQTIESTESSITSGDSSDENQIKNEESCAIKNSYTSAHVATQATANSPIGSFACMDTSLKSNSEKVKSNKKKTKVKYGFSKLTGRLLGPVKKKGFMGEVDLPWSCAIYSVVNWMVAFTDVEGIQILCLKVFPFLLEDESQRTTAQRAGLTDVVLRGMVLFPDSVALHTSAFHTLVLLARPLGGKEGMLFHSVMVNTSSIFNVGSSNGKNGIAVMLDSMRRFLQDEVLQAMGCWSMVNIALVPTQKAVLVKLGGISAASDAMKSHPLNAEVQFRALFALINLVIPSDNLSESVTDAISGEELSSVLTSSERETLDEVVFQVAELVVVAMKNFCSSDAILNRACLVLHNLSLNVDYHNILLWTPNCYQMLEWCIGNYKNDNVLQQSAGGTLQRLQMTLANDNALRVRFAESIRAQQQESLEQATKEANFLRRLQE